MQIREGVEFPMELRPEERYQQEELLVDRSACMLGTLSAFPGGDVAHFDFYFLSGMRHKLGAFEHHRDSKHGDQASGPFVDNLRGIQALLQLYDHTVHDVFPKQGKQVLELAGHEADACRTFKERGTTLLECRESMQIFANYRRCSAVDIGDDNETRDLTEHHLLEGEY